MNLGLVEGSIELVHWPYPWFPSC